MEPSINYFLIHVQPLQLFPGTVLTNKNNAFFLNHENLKVGKKQKITKMHKWYFENNRTVGKWLQDGTACKSDKMDHHCAV